MITSVYVCICICVCIMQKCNFAYSSYFTLNTLILTYIKNRQKSKYHKFLCIFFVGIKFCINLDQTKKLNT